MSIEVELPDLADVLARFRSVYLVTVGGGVRGHIVAVDPTLSERAILLAGIGSTSRANLAVEPSLTLLWPPGSGRGLRTDRRRDRADRSGYRRGAAYPGSPAPSRSGGRRR